MAGCEKFHSNLNRKVENRGCTFRANKVQAGTELFVRKVRNALANVHIEKEPIPLERAPHATPHRKPGT